MRLGLSFLLRTTCLTAVMCGVAVANPVDGVVTAGSAVIAASGNVLNITQSSNKAIIDWRGFDIGSGETTAFHQPGSDSLTLNRVNSTSASVVNGNLTANGNIVIVNQNGILFGGGAHVDVNGLVATTADIDNTRFMNGSTLHFDKAGNPNASVINQGTITVKEAGLVGLVAPNVENSGTITARLGRVHLASGDTTTVDLYGDGLMEVAVSDAVQSQLVRNTGVIAADGGKIALTAAAGSTIVNSLISNTGVLRAQSVGVKNGEITIAAEGSNAVNTNITANTSVKAGHSTVLNSGTLDASGRHAGEHGGKITVTGDTITLQSTTAIDSSGDEGGGSVTIGGGFQGGGALGHAAQLTMEAGASILTNAHTLGNGGDVVLWSDQATSFGGMITADGGIQGGNGGLVETSSHGWLGVDGFVSSKAGSLSGHAGSWLLDPASVNITTTTTNINGTSAFTPTGGAAISNLSATTINNALNAGTNVSVTTGGDGAGGTGDITVSSAISTSGNGSLLLSAYRNILVNNGITLMGGNLTLRTANSGGATTGYITIAAPIATHGGAITMGGGAGAITASNGYAVGNAGQAYGIYVNNTSVDAGSGNIIMNAKGYNGGTNNEFGLYVNGANGLITTGGDGNITLSGIAQGYANNNSNFGVNLANGGRVLTQNGNITVSGTGGGAGSGSKNYGLNISGTNSTLKTIGDGFIYVTAIGGNNAGTGSSNFGMNIASANGIITTGGGQISLDGTGAGNGNDAVGIYITGSVVGSGGSMSLTGLSGNGTGSGNVGIRVYGGSVTNSANGAINLDGTGRGTGNADNAYGVEIDTGGMVSTMDGNIDVATANGGGAGSGTKNYGLFIKGSGSTLKTTGSGDILVSANGGSGNAGGVNYGIYVNAMNGIQTLGGGDINLYGTGGDSSLDNNYGLYVNGGSIVGSGGVINVTGNGGNGTSSYNHGIRLANSSITNNAGGSVTINATGFGTGNSGNDYGLMLGTGSLISAVDGDIQINSHGGGTGSGSNNYGLNMVSSGTAIRTTGGGSIAIQSVGGGSYGTGTVNNGAIIDTGTAIEATGTGNIYLSGTGGNNHSSGHSFGIRLSSSHVTTTSGTLTLEGEGQDAGWYGVQLDNGSFASTGGGGLDVTGQNGIMFKTNATISSAGGSVTIHSPTFLGNAFTINSGGGDIAFDSTVDGPYNLTTNTGSGTTYFNDSLGASTAIHTLNVTGNAFLSGDVTSTQNVTFNNAVTLGNHSMITLGNTGTLTFGDTVDGGYNFTATAGTFSFAAALGSNTPLGAVSLTSVNGLTLPEITADSIFAQTTNTLADIMLSGNLATNAISGTAIQLASAQNFLNSGNYTFTTAGTSRWLVYSTNPANDTLGGLTSELRRFGCSYTSGCAAGVSIPAAGNGFIYSYAPTLTATPSAVSLIYGAAVPSLFAYAYALTDYLGSDASADSVTGSLSGTTAYTPGSAIGSYDITYSSGTLASAMGYLFSYATNNTAISVGTRALTVTATSGQNKVYGAVDPTFAYTLTTGALYGSDAFTGALTRATGETVSGGPYAIGIGLLAASSNYAVTYVGANFAITPYLLSVAATTGLTKTYGAADPALTYSHGILQNSDTNSVFSGGLTRITGESVAGGPYAIGIGTLSAGSNYTLSYTGSSFAITPYSLNIMASAGQTKTYGDVDPTLMFTHGTMQNSDTDSVFSGSLTRTAGETVAGGPYAITLGSLAASNYTLNFTGSNSFSIIPATLTIHANDVSRMPDLPNPTLTASYSGFKFADTPSVISGLTLSTSATALSPIGSYAIIPAGANAANYVFSYLNGTLTINTLPDPVTTVTLPNSVQQVSQDPFLNLTTNAGAFPFFTQDDGYADEGGYNGYANTSDILLTNSTHALSSVMHVFGVNFHGGVLLVDPVLAKRFGLKQRYRFN